MQKQKGFLNIILLVGAIFLSGYIFLGMVLYFFQSDFIYYPDKNDFYSCSAFNQAEKVLFGTTRMYFTERSTDKVIVFYHGNAGRACDRQYLEPFFAEQGYSTIFVEYTGYAEKDSDVSMGKVLKNVSDTVNFLKTKNFKKIVTGGESLGVGPAAYHASLSSVSNLILITAYNNMASVVSSHYPIYPVKLLLKNNYIPDEWLSGYTGPISMILAGDDESISNKLGRKLYDGLQSQLKSIYVIENVGHNSIYNSDDFYDVLGSALK